MPTPRPPCHRRHRRLLIGLLAVPVSLVLAASPASADTSSASASAVQINLLGTPIPPPSTVGNDGTQPTQTAGFDNGLLTLLPTNGFISAGALGQIAVANPDGTSAACAGLISPGSAIGIGPDGACSDGNTTTGIVVSLLGLASVEGGAVSAQCTADSAGNVAGSSNLANLAVYGPVIFGIKPKLLDLALDPPPNTGISIPGIAELLLNKQVVNPDGSLTVTAFTATVLGTGFSIGQVSCGPNVLTADIPLLPVGGAPLAAGIALTTAGVIGINRYRTHKVARAA